MGKVADSSVEPEKKSGGLKEALCGSRAQKWAFMFIVGFLALLTVRDVTELVMDYFEYPKTSEMSIMFNDSMTMPNITFCMSRTQAWSHFKINESAPVDEWDMIVDESLSNMTTKQQFLTQLWDFRLVMEAYDMIATYNSMERETTAHGSARTINLLRISPRLAGKRKTFKKWNDALRERDVSFEEFTQKTGSEVLRRSMQRFQRTTFDEDLVIKTKLRTSWISMMQICFQPMFDQDNYHPINDQGAFFTMLLSHNAENLNGQSLECMSVDLHGRPSSLNRFMEGKGRARDGFTFELCAGQRHEVTVEVRAMYTMLENEEEGTACKDREDDDEEESEFDCRSRCRMDMIREMCNCTAMSLSYLAKDDIEKFPLCDYTQCTVDVQGRNWSDTDCSNKCRRDCRQIRFELDHAVQGRMVRPDLTLINLNWGSFEYLTMEQNWKYTVTDFIAALGGNLGMWLGLSILSLIQGGSYLYKKISERITKRSDSHNAGRRGSKISIAHIEDTVTKKISIAANPFENPFISSSPSPTPNSDMELRDRAPPGYSRNPNPTKIQVD